MTMDVKVWPVEERYGLLEDVEKFRMFSMLSKMDGIDNRVEKGWIMYLLSNRFNYLLFIGKM